MIFGGFHYMFVAFVHDIQTNVVSDRYPKLCFSIYILPRSADQLFGLRASFHSKEFSSLMKISSLNFSLIYVNDMCIKSAGEIIGKLFYKISVSRMYEKNKIK